MGEAPKEQGPKGVQEQEHLPWLRKLWDRFGAREGAVIALILNAVSNWLSAAEVYKLGPPPFWNLVSVVILVFVILSVSKKLDRAFQATAQIEALSTRLDATRAEMAKPAAHERSHSKAERLAERDPIAVMTEHLDALAHLFNNTPPGRDATQAWHSWANEVHSATDRANGDLLRMSLRPDVRAMLSVPPASQPRRKHPGFPSHPQHLAAKYVDHALTLEAGMKGAIAAIQAQK